MDLYKNIINNLKESTEDKDWEEVCKAFCEKIGAELLFVNDDSFGYQTKDGKLVHMYADELEQYIKSGKLNESASDETNFDKIALSKKEARGAIAGPLELLLEQIDEDEEYACEVFEQNIYEAILDLLEKKIGYSLKQAVDNGDDDISNEIYNKFVDEVYQNINIDLDDAAQKLANIFTLAVVNRGYLKKMNEADVIGTNGMYSINCRTLANACKKLAALEYYEKNAEQKTRKYIDDIYDSLYREYNAGILTNAGMLSCENREQAEKYLDKYQVFSALDSLNNNTWGCVELKTLKNITPESIKDDLIKELDKFAN